MANEYDTVISGNIGSGEIGSVHIGDSQVLSGNIGSGQISPFHLASGAITAGAIGSGAIVSGAIASGAAMGSLGGGAFNIASGTVGPNDLGSGSILSGAIASGQIGNFAVSSGAVTSGRLGTTGTPDGTKFLRDDFQWTAASFSLTSGQVQSGNIASGAVQGFFGATRHIASGTVGVFDFGSGAVIAGTVGSGAVVSGNIASGQIGPNHLGSGAVLSGAIASGQVGKNHLASGAVQSGNIASGAIFGQKVGGFQILSGTIGTLEITDLGITSGKIFSGAVIGSLGGHSEIASGTVGPNDLGSGSVLSGAIASGQVTNFKLGSGAVNSGHVGSGSVVGAIGAGRSIASGTVAHPDFGSGAIQSGDIASGQIGANHLASGVLTTLLSGSIATDARYVIDDFSAGGTPLITEETISGFVAVSISRSGNLQIAMLSVSKRLPAVGIAVSGALSGQACSFWTEGFFQTTSGLVNFSGSLGTPIYVTTSGQLSQLGASYLSGGFSSGQPHQKVGIAINSGGLRVSIDQFSRGDGSDGATNPWIFSGDLQAGMIASPHIRSGGIVNESLANASVMSAQIASGSIGNFSIASGAIGSGAVASGAVVGAIGAGRSIASGTVAHNDFGSGAILSGDIASGQIGQNHLASGSVTSGVIASGQVGQNALSSGSVTSGAIASGQVGQNALSSGSVTSGAIASGQVTNFKLGSGAVNSGHVGSGAVLGSLGGGALTIASGTIGPNDLGSGSVLSGAIASGQVGQNALSSGSVTSGAIASGQVTNFKLGSGAVNSGHVGSGSVVGSIGAGRSIASGTVAHPDFGSGAILSGDIASGQIGPNHLASGVLATLVSGSIATNARYIIDDFSAAGTPLVTAENVSGFVAVAVTQSGTLQVAMASVSGRMPAIGIAVSGALSGQACSFWTAGPFQIAVNSGSYNFSGYVGQPLYVGRSGQLGPISGGFLSGGFASGDLPQTIGVIVNSGAARLSLDLTIKGGPLAIPGTFWIQSGDIASGQVGTATIASGGVLSGNIASGQIGQNHLASGSVSSGAIASGQVTNFKLGSGAVNSGHVGSGAILGSVGGGAFTIASGTIGPNDLGSGAVLSGAIASGQIGQNALSSGSVTSGAIASGQVTNFKLGSGAVNSGHVASGAVLGSLGGGAFTIASGTIGPNDLGSGSVLSGAIASGQVGQNHLASGSVTSGAIASGQVTNFKLGSGAVNSGHVGSGSVVGAAGAGRSIASGTVAHPDFGSGAIQSGDIASGQIGANHLQSGVLNVALSVIVSGLITGENTSGAVAVVLGTSGVVFQAMAAQSGRMPALGLINFTGNVDSGQTLNVVVAGRIDTNTGVNAAMGAPYFVGLSGDITPNPPTLAGSIIQAVGIQEVGSSRSGVIVQIQIPASGHIAAREMASGAIGSGTVASGSVMGSLGPVANIASGTIGPNELGSGSVLSGAIASGQIGQNHLASGSVSSGAIASGQVTNLKLGSGAVTSGIIASGQIGPNHLGSGAVTSGAIASGQVGHFHISSGAVTSGTIGMGGSPTGTNFFRDDFTWAAATATLTSGQVQSGNIASGAVQGFFGSTRNIASGTVGGTDLGSGALLSGSSASGFVAAIAQNGIIFAYANEPISGVRAVQFLGTTSGFPGIRIAMADSLNRLPANGIVFENVASGVLTNVYTAGFVIPPSGQIAVGAAQPLYVGRSGALTPNVPPTLSGSQLIAFGANNSGIIVWPQPSTIPGVVAPYIFAGAFASGTIGAVQAGGTFPSFDIASGAIWNGIMASGAILSGAIASGQVGQFAISSGAVTSGRLGVTGTPDGTKILRDDFTWVAPSAPTISSGSVQSGASASGFLANFAQGGIFLAAATEPISGIRAVTSFFASVSGYPNVRIAMPDVSTREIACGIVIDNVTSGSLCNVFTAGNIFLSGLGGLSVAGQPVYLVKSGILAASPPAGLLQTQVLGTMTSHSGMIVQVSPGPTTRWIGPGAIMSGVINSDNMGSGSILQGSLTKPLTVEFIRLSTIFDLVTAFGTVSGGFAVCLMSGQGTGGNTELVQVAKAGDPGKMPAVGICVSGGLSGAAVTIARGGMAFSDNFTVSGSFQDFPNQLIPGAPAYVGMSGEITVAPRLFLSGTVLQPVGVTYNNSGLMVDMGTQYSGSIGPFALSSGALMSGMLGLNSVTSGRLASGAPATVAYSVWLEDGIVAGETISGYTLVNTVQIGNGQSGLTVMRASTADTNAGGSFPCDGVILQNVLSGATVRVLRKGIIKNIQLQAGAGSDFYLNRSGGLTAGLPSASGYLQRLGTVLNVSGATLFNDLYFDPTLFGNQSDINNLRMASGAVMSGNVASGQIGHGHFKNQGVLSGDIGGNVIGPTHIATNSLDNTVLASGAVTSGMIASGQIGQNHLASGLYGHMIAEWFNTAETISGLKAVCFASGDGSTIVRADRQSGLRLPSFGVTISGAVSGSAALVVIIGKITGGAASGAIASGFHGRPLYVGSGGLIVNQSGYMGGASSGAPTLSGSLVQRVGTAISGGIFVNADVTLLSGLISGLLMQF